MLDGLAMLLDAGGLEDLFGGPDDEAAFLYDLLRETARGRASAHYWETCRTARRRSVTPEYVIDRAAVLLASIEERRRADLYRLLGAPPLSSPDTLRQRYLELAKTAHPDVGGDPERFRHVKEAYEILRDPERRAEYERFWVRALGPFERVVPDDSAEGVGAVVTTRVAAVSPAVPSRDVREDVVDDAPLGGPPSAFEIAREADGASQVGAPDDAHQFGGPSTDAGQDADLARPGAGDVTEPDAARFGHHADVGTPDERSTAARDDDARDLAGEDVVSPDTRDDLAPTDEQHVAAPHAHRAAPHEPPPEVVDAPMPRAPERRVVMVGRAMGTRERPQDVVAAAAASVLEARANIERRLGPIGGTAGVFALIERVEGALGAVSRDDLARAQAEVARSIADMEAVRTKLELIAHLQRQVAKLVTG